MRNALSRWTKPDLVRPAVRFPVALLAAGSIAGEAIWTDTSRWLLVGSPESMPWRFGCVVALLASIAAGLASERAAASRRAALQLGAALLGLGVWFAYSGSWISPFWCVVALCGLVASSIAPAGNRELWAFNVRAVMLLALSFFAVSVVIWGVYAILSAIQYLFDMKPDRRWMEIITTVGYWFAFPVYWCALLPARDDLVARFAPGDFIAKAVAVVGVLVALISLALTVLLHAYAAKIAYDGALPKNQVGWIVSVFLSVGLFGWLACAAEEGPAARIQRLFRQVWIPLTVVPIVLLGFALYERVHAYGVTIDRYVVGVIAGVGVGCLLLAVAVRGVPKVRHVLAVVTIAAAVTAIGPQGVRNVVTESQIVRLRAILDAERLTEAGRVTAPVPIERLSNVRRSEINSILAELDKVGGLFALARIAPAEQVKTVHAARTFFAANRWPIVDRAREVVALTDIRGVAPVTGGRLVGPITLGRQGWTPPKPAGDSLWPFVATLDGAQVKVREGETEMVFDLAPFATEPRNGPSSRIAATSADGAAVLRVVHLNMSSDGQRTSIDRLEGWLFVSDR